MNIGKRAYPRPDCVSDTAPIKPESLFRAKTAKTAYSFLIAQTASGIQLAFSPGFTQRSQRGKHAKTAKNPALTPEYREACKGKAGLESGMMDRALSTPAAITAEIQRLIAQTASALSAGCLVPTAHSNCPDGVRSGLPVRRGCRPCAFRRQGCVCARPSRRRGTWTPGRHR